MAQFPIREAEIVVFAQDMAALLTINAAIYPAQLPLRRKPFSRLPTT